MTKTKKVLRTIVVLGLVGALAAVGAFSAFSAQTDNPGNVVTAGTVDISDNDSGTAFYDMTLAKPGDAQERCFVVSYTGSLPAGVRMYRTGALGGLADDVNLRVRTGTGTAANCSDFVSGSTEYTGKLDGFAGSYAGASASGPAAWTNPTSVTYAVRAELDPSTPDTEQGASTGTHSFVWEAQNN
jgi:hypothetical protein